ncbi:MAG: integrase [Pseudomonas sp.]|nr:integrase [Pseudomonas sp.]
MGYTDVKRSEIKRRPLSDTVLASVEPETREYRELDGNGVYLRVRPDGQKSWQLRYKNQAGKWSWLGLGGYPQVDGALARNKAAELRKEIAQGEDPLANKKGSPGRRTRSSNQQFRIFRPGVDRDSNTRLANQYSQAQCRRGSHPARHYATALGGPAFSGARCCPPPATPGV